MVESDLSGQSWLRLRRRGRANWLGDGQRPDQSASDRVGDHCDGQQFWSGHAGEVPQALAQRDPTADEERYSHLQRVRHHPGSAMVQRVLHRRGRHHKTLLRGHRIGGQGTEARHRDRRRLHCRPGDHAGTAFNAAVQTPERVRGRSRSARRSAGDQPRVPRLHRHHSGRRRLRARNEHRPHRNPPGD